MAKKPTATKKQPAFAAADLPALNRTVGRPAGGRGLRPRGAQRQVEAILDRTGVAGKRRSPIELGRTRGAPGAKGIRFDAKQQIPEWARERLHAPARRDLMGGRSGKYRLPVFGQTFVDPAEQRAVRAKFDKRLRERREYEAFMQGLVGVEMRLGFGFPGEKQADGATSFNEISRADALRGLPGKPRRPGKGQQEPRAAEPPPAIEVRLVLSNTVIVPSKHSERKNRLAHISLFAETSKMAAPSYSMPAGPPQHHGSCPAADKTANDRLRWICDGCYATDGNYLYPDQAAMRYLRMQWTRKSLKAGTFARDIIDGLTVLTRYPNYSLDLDPRFFRIHDSGDFMASAEYVLAWGEIAHAFPQIHFWAPTRDWAFCPSMIAKYDLAKNGFRPNPALEAAFIKVTRENPNLVIRPSALHVGDEPPVVPFLSAGSTVLEGPRRVKGKTVDSPGTYNGVERCGFISGAAHCHCPAYEYGDTCANAQCRTCWVKPTVTVDYPAH